MRPKYTPCDSTASLFDGKVCTRCKTWNPNSNYKKYPRNTSDGLFSHCRKCDNKNRVESRARHLDVSRAYGKLRYQREMADPIAKAKIRADSTVKSRRYCQRIGNMYQHCKGKNPEAFMLKKRIARHKYRELVRNAEGSFTAAQWLEVKALYGDACLSCGSTQSISIDHVVPLSKGGRNDISNIQPLCLTCNKRKSSKTIDYRPKLIDV